MHCVNRVAESNLVPTRGPNGSGSPASQKLNNNMATLADLRRKIETATDLGTVVSTMKTLAAVRIRQYEASVKSLGDYSRTIDLGFQILLRDQPGILGSEQPRRTGAVIFGSDQGMCGQFNNDIVGYANDYLRSMGDIAAVPILVVGSRAKDIVIDSGLVVDRLYQVATSVTDITNLVLEILPQVEGWQTELGITQVLLFYNYRTTAATFEPTDVQMLPIGFDRTQQWRTDHWQSNSLPTFATDRSQLLSRLVRQFLFVSLFRASAESLASENASRIAAMQAAEKNIQDRLDELSATFHQIRQTAITEEILDVIAGFEALADR